MPSSSDIAEHRIRLTELVSAEGQKQLTDRVRAMADSGASRAAVDCSDIPLLTGEHIWLLLQVQSLCQMHNIEVTITAPVSTLFNIETLGSLIEASSSLTKRVVPAAPETGSQLVESKPRRLEQQVKARASDLAKATREFEAFVDRLKPDKADRYVLRTIYTEAVQNIYRHAGLKDTQGITIQVEITGKCLSLTFVDEGPEFDPTADPSFVEHMSDPTAVEFPHFGIKMLRKLADDMIYQRSQSGKNVLRIIKELQI